MNKINYLFHVVPDELQVRYAARGDRMSLDQWELGDDANSLWERAVEHNWEVWKHDIYEFISVAHNYVVSARSVRDYAAIADFYDQETRAKYDVLSFNHFRVARSFGNYWESVLDGALQYMDEHNRPPSGDWLVAHYRGVNQIDQVVEIDRQSHDLAEIKSIVDRDYNDVPASGEVVNEQTGAIVELTYKQHAMMQGLARAVRFLRWACQRLPDLGVVSYEFDSIVESLEQAVAKVLRDLTNTEKSDMM